MLEQSRVASFGDLVPIRGRGASGLIASDTFMFSAETGKWDKVIAVLPLWDIGVGIQNRCLPLLWRYFSSHLLDVTIKSQETAFNLWCS